ncbi:MAG: hypothetical protein QW607_05570 [Desulfurococcaceae archaeon]
MEEEEIRCVRLTTGELLGSFMDILDFADKLYEEDLELLIFLLKMKYEQKFKKKLNEDETRK